MAISLVVFREISEVNEFRDRRISKFSILPKLLKFSILAPYKLFANSSIKLIPTSIASSFGAKVEVWLRPAAVPTPSR